MAKAAADEAWFQGYDPEDGFVCASCAAEDAYLANAIAAEAVEPVCDFCGQDTSPEACAAPVELLQKLVTEGILREYEHPEEQLPYDSSEGGWQLADVLDTWDVLSDYHPVTDNRELHALLSNTIRGQWCQRDPFELPPDQTLRSGWDRFRHYVTHERRYTFLLPAAEMHRDERPLPEEMLEILGELIAETGLATVLPAGSRWFRGRPHDAGLSYDSATDLGSAPAKKAKNNRMTPAGISGFYGANDLGTAVAEIRGYAPGSYITVAEFQANTPLPVIDLTGLPDVPSLYDTERATLRSSILFLHAFAADVAKPAEPTDTSSLSYVPTQVVAEYLHHHFVHPGGTVLGVLWRSTKDPAATDAVLFIDNEHCVADDPGWDDSDEPRLALLKGTVTRKPPRGK